MRLAAAVDDLADPHEAALRRIALPLAKFWVCKRTPAVTAEALECLGGNGYVEESLMPLLYREAPLNSVWEGSGNVNALDVLRALGREPEALDAWITEVGMARGGDARLDRAIDDTLALLGSLMGDPAGLEVNARRLAGRMAAVLQGSLLVRFSPPEVADVFCASRLGTSYDGTFGALDGGDLRGIVERTTPTRSRRAAHPRLLADRWSGPSPRGRSVSEQFRRQPLLDDQPAAVRLERPQPRGVRHPALPAAGHLAPLEQQPGPLHALGVDGAGRPSSAGPGSRAGRSAGAGRRAGRSPRTRWARGTPLPRLPQPPPMPPAIPNGDTDSNRCSTVTHGG